MKQNKNEEINYIANNSYFEHNRERSGSSDYKCESVTWREEKELSEKIRKKKVYAVKGYSCVNVCVWEQKKNGSFSVIIFFYFHFGFTWTCSTNVTTF